MVGSRKRVANPCIKIVVTSNIPLRVILHTSPTTASLNFISWNKAYSIFPRSTFLDHETLPLKPVDWQWTDLHRQYSGRGWRMRTEPIREDIQKSRKNPYGIWPDRRVGDKESWVLRLDTTSVEKPSRPDFVLELSGFHIWAPFKWDVPLHERSSWLAVRTNLCVHITSFVFQSPSLRYKYTFSRAGDQGKFWKHLGRIFSRNTLGQLMKLASNYFDVILNGQQPWEVAPHSLEFVKPQGWDYYDDMVLTYFEEGFPGEEVAGGVQTQAQTV
ncbi:uncharacterized protein F4822DRAFT_416656 [Hypoxylon trugodes]|uniref:uncharacterized protein n=1 Tax=Hypoxylon trugodes TaxID=326681 RepID=UPI00219B9086|nr:uncharacterized protein F4822DRAFT_416656 [Hypoxylon trugodes]KAI1384906.1 hypothetical protein F4822DRAFT_416656 [Hypoxylon trugodes]